MIPGWRRRRKKRRRCRLLLLLLLLAHGVTGRELEREREREKARESLERGTEARGRESRLQVFRSLMCDLPQTRQSVPPFPSGSAGFKESALGPPPPPLSFSYAFLQNPTGIPYYTATARANFLSRETLLSAFRRFLVERRNAPREKNPEVTLSLSLSLSLPGAFFPRFRERENPKNFNQNYFSIGL